MPKMPILCIEVKEARLQGFSSSVAVLVALDVNGAKSFTRTLTGCNPIWNEEFSYELDSVDGGVLLEVQLKGFLRRQTIGAFYVPIKKVRQGAAAVSGDCRGISPKLPNLIQCVKAFQLRLESQTLTGTATLDKLMDMQDFMNTFNRKLNDEEYK
ncbi:Phorbol ester/diacylglycerol-binding protein unc-13 [Echinococcus granulosus]|uniref:Phorbol ester/diacylglycerol-binding protein unc-13 n=1 Tax=Echinococcus granulosus TaxID=6210 RepID=W6UIC4_ECHGR|nr:Phorbol ester/diacylglycerol-binding protein unc-13 [Echinococcus granulosus]EUB60851.1 Phorbol ester/diacylglycerol-binding protein unc-13 [Echinococcus granulosus]